MKPAAAGVACGVAGASARLRRALKDPGAIQQRHLAQLLARNVGSQFGRDHAFSAIRNEADYASHVPIRTYEALWPWISDAASGVSGVLTAEPVIVFEETGGSSAGPRLIPYTASGLTEFQAGLHAWLDDLFLAEPGLDQGTFYWSISPACRPPRFTASGARVGMAGDAAYFGAELAPHIVASLAVPAAVGDCTDLADWRYRTLLHLLAHDDLALISVWSPTFLTELLGAARADGAALATALAAADQVGPRRAAIVADELGQPAPRFARIWPRLRVISCWDQASARGHAELLRAWFPDVRVQGKGLLATEALVSIPLQGHPYPVLALESGYFEFREPTGRIRTAASVEDGGEYELIISNRSGLYRYAIGDTVRVSGFADRTPMLEFLGRAGGSDLCGEKLSEAFVQQSLTSLRLHFCALAPDARSMHYRLLVDAAEVGTDAARGVVAAVEAALCRNPQYGHARALGQLGAIDVLRCPNPASRWIELRLQAGQRLGDIKLPVLIVNQAQVHALQA